MNRHSSINRIPYRISSEVSRVWVPVAETGKGSGKSGHSRSIAKRGVFAAAISLVLSPLAHAAPPSSPCASPACGSVALSATSHPTGAQVVSGSGSITQSGNTTDIRQSSPNLAIDWLSFNLGSQATVDFIQPSASAVAVNRILGNDGSDILGHIDANGQVWLINPNGIVFGQGAVVNVGGLVASTLAAGDSSSSGGSQSFAGAGTGGVLNQGTISAAQGGYVALLGNQVVNQGTVTARLGTVALGAGSAATLTFAGNALVKMQVDRSTLDNLAANGGLIQADGGQVIMSAGAENALLASVVNNTGVIEARTVENHAGTITLLGGMTAGTVNVGGTLDASAPEGGNGGSIETSGAQVKVANDAKVTTLAATGKTGMWLVDPTDFTVAPSGGDISGATLSSDLNSTNTTILSSSGTSPVTGGGSGGNINVNDTVSWSANTTLTLTAANNVNVNANVTATGDAAGLIINPNTGNGSQVASGTGALNLNMGNSITLSGANPTLSIAGNSYTVINSLGTAGSTTGTDLQGINGNLAGFYALGSDIDATATSSWNGGAGLTPIGAFGAPFTGTFNGLGHTISNLTFFNNSYADGAYGLFGDTSGAILNVGLIGESMWERAGGSNAILFLGGLAGENTGTISNSYATGTSIGIVGGDGTSITQGNIGGLVGSSSGPISDSYAAVAISGGNVGMQTVSYGGLVGNNIASITNSYATGSLTSLQCGDGPCRVGGLAGYNSSTIGNSFATGSLSYFNGVIGLSQNTVNGGLVGYNDGTYGQGSITNSYATGNVTAAGGEAGGLVGFNIYHGTVTNSYATGSVVGNNYVGGLVGYNQSSVSNSYATGAVTGAVGGGGLVGGDDGFITNSYATGPVTGGDYLGGLAGWNGGTITNSYSAGSVSSSVGGSHVGGIVGYNTSLVTPTQTGLIINSFWDITTSGQSTSAGGPSSGGGTGMVTADMQTQANFTSATNANGNVNPGWDFANTWVMYGGYTYPLLRAFMTPLTVTANGATVTYDQQAYSGGNGVTYSVTPNANLLGTLAYGGTSQGAINAGTYTIVPGGLYSNQQGYVITFASGTLTINPLALTGASIAAAGSSYGAPVTPGTVSFSNLFPGDVVTSAVSIVNPAYSGSNHLNAGGYAQSASSTLGGANAEDYTFAGYTTPTNTYTVSQLALTGAAISTANSTYGSTVSPGALSFGNVLAGDAVGATVSIVSPTYSTSNHLNAGNYAQSASTLTGADAGDYTFSGFITPTNNYSVSPLALTGTAISAVGTTYGTPAAPGAVSFGNILVGDLVSSTASLVNPAFSTSGNLAAGGYAQTASPLTGADAGNYAFLGYTTPTGNYTVNPLTLTVTGLSAANKVYNGNNIAGLNGTASIAPITNDAVTLVGTGTGTFADANVGTGKAVAVSGYTLTGADAGDYSLSEPAGLTANISQLASVTWIGGATGNWSNAANWAGGAIPDYANVAAVTIPSGKTVTYDSGVPGTTTLTSLTDGGTLVMAAGNLSTTGNLSTAGYKQTGGTLDVEGTLSVNSNTAAVTLGNIDTASLDITSKTGAITQAAATTLYVTGATTLTGDVITLANSTNNFEGAVASDGYSIKVVDDGAGGLILGNTTATGTLTDTSRAGAITQAAATAIDATGPVSLTANNGLAGSSAVAYNITLADSGNNIAGSVNTSGLNIDLFNSNAGGLALGNTTVGGTLTVTSAAGAITQAGSTQIKATGATILTADNGNITLANAANKFTGAVTASGTAITLDDSVALTADLDSTGAASVTSAKALTVAGTIGTSLTTVATGKTTFGTTAVGTTLTVTSTGAVKSTTPGILTVAGKKTTTANPDVTVNGTVGALIK
jgi:filamentous hemagglutinin family protein